MDNVLPSLILIESYKKLGTAGQYGKDVQSTLWLSVFETCNETNLCVSRDLYFIEQLHHKICILSKFYRTIPSVWLRWSYAGWSENEMI